MILRKAELADAQPIAATYDALFAYEKTHGSSSNWQQGVYPTIAVPHANIPAHTMYVLEDQGQICASMILNQKQADEYQAVSWKYAASDSEVLVIHTLCVPPYAAGRGYGTQMLNFAKQYALRTGCTVIRIDTYAHNEAAKTLYLRQGFSIAGYGTMLLQGVIEEEQVYLEYIC